MTTLLDLFIWPCPFEEKIAPVWMGESFEFSSGKKSSVLECSKTESQWSDELTLLHELEAGNGSHPIDVSSRMLVIETFKKYLSKKENIILDVGCSSGFLLKDLQKYFSNNSIIGADYIAEPLKRLREQVKGIPLLQFDLRNSPLPDACVDAISCINVLEHIDDDTAALGEIYRMLKPGGIAHIEVPAVPSCFDIYDEHLMHHRHYKMPDLIRKASKLGFHLLRKTHLGFLIFPAFYIVKKKNQRLLAAPAEEKSVKVKEMMKNTSVSPLMKSAMKMELLLRKIMTFPIGIRCVLILKK